MYHLDSSPNFVWRNAYSTSNRFTRNSRGNKQIFNPSFGGRSKMLFDKIQKMLFWNFYLESTRIVLKEKRSEKLSKIKSILFKVNKTENQFHFLPLSQIPEEEEIETILTGFQLQAIGKISLKKYYESTDPNSLFQLKTYFIKYEAIRKSKLYNQLRIQ